MAGHTSSTRYKNITRVVTPSAIPECLRRPFTSRDFGSCSIDHVIYVIIDCTRMMQTFQDLLYTLYFRGYYIIANHLYFGSFAVSLKGALMQI